MYDKVTRTTENPEAATDIKWKPSFQAPNKSKVLVSFVSLPLGIKLTAQCSLDSKTMKMDLDFLKSLKER